MIDQTKLKEKIKEVTGGNTTIIPNIIKAYIESCPDEDMAVVVVKSGIVDEVVFTDQKYKQQDLVDAIYEHVPNAKDNFALEYFEYISTKKEFVEHNTAIFIIGD